MSSRRLSPRVGFGDALLLGSRRVQLEKGFGRVQFSLEDPAALKVNPCPVGE